MQVCPEKEAESTPCCGKSLERTEPGDTTDRRGEGCTQPRTTDDSLAKRSDRERDQEQDCKRRNHSSTGNGVVEALRKSLRCFLVCWARLAGVTIWEERRKRSNRNVVSDSIPFRGQIRQRLGTCTELSELIFLKHDASEATHVLRTSLTLTSFLSLQLCGDRRTDRLCNGKTWVVGTSRNAQCKVRPAGNTHKNVTSDA